MKTVKRTLAVLLTLLMLMSFVPVGVMNAVAANNPIKTILDQVESVYGAGTYFTANRKACNHSNTSKCNNCKLSYILDSTDCKTIKRYSNSTYNAGTWTCFSFASFCFTQCFGKSYVKSNFTKVKDSNDLFSSRTDFSNQSVEKKKEFFSFARIGDIIKCFRYAKGEDGKYHYYHKHSMVFIGADSSGVTVFDANYNGDKNHTGTVRKGRIKYENIKHYNIEILRANNYNDIAGSAPDPTPPSPTPDITATWSNYSVKTISATNAEIRARVTFNKSVKHEKCGFYFGTQSGKLTKNAKFDTINKNRTYTDMWYDLNKFGQTLKAGTKYYYQFFIVANGKEYKSAEKTLSLPTSEPTPSITASWSKYNATNITETNAKIEARVTFNKSVKHEKCGFYFGTQSGKLTKNAKYDTINKNRTYTDMWYDLNKWYGKLTPGTTYYYQFFIVANGTEYKSAEKSFKTKGTPATDYNFTVKYNANGGTGTMADQTVKVNQALTLTKNSFTKAGYDFAGWYVKRNSDSKWYVANQGWETESDISKNKWTKKLYDDGGNYTFGVSWTNGSKTTDTFTFYAVWKECEHVWNEGEVTKEPTTKETGVKTFTCERCGKTKTEKIPKITAFALKFAANGGKGTMSGTSVRTGETFVLPACEFTKAGAAFGGWAVKRSSDSKWYTTEGTWETSKNIKANNLSKEVFEVESEYELNEDWINGAKNTDTYTFYAVWIACEHEWDDGEVTKEPTTKATGVMTYTCELCGATKKEKIPKLASYQIKYAANGGKGTMTGTKVLKDDAITLSECEFTRAGYTFSGWMVKRTSDSKWLTEEDGWKTDKVIKAEELTKTVFDSDTEISLDEDWINGTKNVDTYTFYAVWVKE